MGWTVVVPRRVAGKVEKLPARVHKALTLLVHDIENKGPVRGNWPNYGKLGPRTHHCHLKKGKAPTYVAVWNESENEIRLVEVTYVGTHAKASY